MKLIIAGSRNITDADEVIKIIERTVRHSGWNITEVITGGARGVDSIAIKWAENNKIYTRIFFPEYTKEIPVKVSPIIRNKKMAEYGDVLLAIWDGKSSGTENMIHVMKEIEGKITVVVIYRKT